ncbi:MAG: hypothetical protein GOVbin7759_60 [Prokaryotic dsDNA virus sp.]|jgi:hypothetical protein|nr:MAG: hypothetical protein GOVbin7759_60 [Prokaryotic dsDNA virus sp.]|tara:strand:- start:3 stop:719 length:717 start_codon:yes stop_codon:yes gene_type:complete
MALAPIPAGVAQVVDPVAQALTPAEPFVWGHGGLKMTPQQAAMMRERGQQRMRGDYSPVQHWTQGLARVADNVLGALEAKKADKALEEGAAADRALMEAMVSGGVDDSMIARALMDPNVGEGVRQFAGMEYQRRQPAKAPAPTDIEKLMMARGIERGSDVWNKTLDAAITGKTDPFTVLQTGTGTFMGPQSLVQQALQEGGGPTSGAPAGGEPPAVLPPDFFDDNGGGGGGNVTDPFR